MTVMEALAEVRKAVENGDAAGIRTTLDEAERIAAIVPEIAVQLQEGMVVEVSRANDAPYVLHVHDHDVTGDSPSRLVWPDGSTEPVVISTHGPKVDETRTSEIFWDSLRNPVADADCLDDVGGVDIDSDPCPEF